MAELVIKLVNGELAGKTMQEVNKQVRDAAKELSKAKAGTEEFVKATQKLEQAKGLQADMKKQIDATAKASTSLKDSFGQILNQIPGFSQISGVMNQARAGVGGLTSGFGSLKGAIIATGIGALIIAVTALVGWFSKTEKGANIISGAFKGMGAVVDTLMGKLWNIGNTLKELFSNPIEFFKNLGKDIANAAKEGYNFVAVFDDIEDRQRELDVRAKQQDIMIDQMLMHAKNVGKTFEEKTAILEKAEKITRDIYKEQLDLSKENADAVEAEIKATLKNQGVIIDGKKDLLLIDEITGEQADRLRDARLNYYDILGQETQVLDKIQNFRDKIFVKEEKAIEKQTKNEEKQNEKRKQSDYDSKAVLEKAEELHWQRKGAISMQGAANNLANQILNDKLATEEERKAYADREQALKDHLARVEQNEGMAKQRLLGDTLRLGADILNAKIDNSKFELAQIKEKYGAESIEYQKAATKEGDRIKQWEKQKVALNLISEISNIWKTSSEFGPFGYILAGIQTAAALVRANQANQNINRMKFATGGAVYGPSHAGGGVPIEAEGGEFMFSRKATSAIGVGLLESINRRLTFADGGMVPKNPFDLSRGAVASGNATASSALAPEFDYGKLAATIAANMQNEIYKIKVVNNLQETEKGLTTLNQLKSEWDV